MVDKMIIVFILSVTMSITLCVPADEQEDTSGDKVSAKTLHDVATQFNLTLLEIISKAMLNHEKDNKEEAEKLCPLHPCSKWSNWSECDVSADTNGQVGVKSRSRLCGGNTTLCMRYGMTKNESEHEVCKKLCPTDYTVTKNGFCLKYYAGPKTWGVAEAQCRSDGGHLVNVDSEVKAHDVNETLSSNSFSGSKIWIDGNRSSRSSPWTYGYESTDPTFVFWGRREPDNGYNDKCMMYEKDSSSGNEFRWNDYLCTQTAQFVCQATYY